jgi:hypothetical protein
MTDTIMALPPHMRGRSNSLLCDIFDVIARRSVSIIGQPEAGYISDVEVSAALAALAEAIVHLVAGAPGFEKSEAIDQFGKEIKAHLLRRIPEQRSRIQRELGVAGNG